MGLLTASELSFPLDFARLARSGRPNDCLFLPAQVSSEARADGESPHFPLSPDALEEAWVALASARPRVVLHRRDGDRKQVWMIERSALFRFPDDVVAQFVPMDGGSSLAVYSRSRYGHSDLGVNRRRVAAWLGDLERRIAGGA